MSASAGHCSWSRISRAFNRQLILPSSTKIVDPTKFTFAIMADPQLGLLERWVEKLPPPHSWQRELDLVKRTISAVNRLDPKPIFLLICGDLVDAQPLTSGRQSQLTDLVHALSELHPEIDVVVLPGNHDIGDQPSPKALAEYREQLGDDYFTFRLGCAKFYVLNSQFLFDSSLCSEDADKFRQWLDTELSKNSREDLNVVFQHIPPFVRTGDEPSAYFNLPPVDRVDLLTKLHSSHVRHVFSGHLHYNNHLTWSPLNSPSNDPIHLVTTTSTGVQLGSDKPGVRLVEVDGPSSLTHSFFSLDQLEKLLANNQQPCISNNR